MKEGWTYKKLGEVCNLYQPRTISTKEMVADGKYNVFGANGIIGKYNEYNHEYPEILMTCRGATCGNINISTPKAWINGNAMVIHIVNEKELTKDYLVHALTNIDKSHIITGAAQPQITRQTLSPLEIPLPPLSEQQRIVKQLDEAFAEIDTIKAAAEKQLSEAKALFQKALSKAMTPKEGWEEKTLKEIGDTQTGNTPSKNDKSNYGDYIPFIRPAEINYDGLGNINYNSEMSLSEKGLENGRLFKSGSVFMVCIGATIGKVAISTQDVSCNQQINILTPNSNTNAKFAFYAMSSKAFNNKVLKEGMSAQATLPIISKGKWEKLSIPIPPLSDQQRIVEELDELAENVKEIEKLNDKLTAECDAMKQALLRQVFE